MRNKGNRMKLLTAFFAAALIVASCTPAFSAADSDGNAVSGNPDPAAEEQMPSGSAGSARSAVEFNHVLDSYEPLKDHYNFYFTYKTVHPWWDAVALGMEEAQRQYLERGITITYEYMAPEGASAEDQTRRLMTAKQKDYDVIGVDVADEDIISPVKSCNPCRKRRCALP